MVAESRAEKDGSGAAAELLTGIHGGTTSEWWRKESEGEQGDTKREQRKARALACMAQMDQGTTVGLPTRRDNAQCVQSSVPTRTIRGERDLLIS